MPQSLYIFKEITGFWQASKNFYYQLFSGQKNRSKRNSTLSLNKLFRYLQVELEEFKLLCTNRRNLYRD